MSEVVVMTKADLESVIASTARVAVQEAIRKLPRADQPRPFHVNQTQAAEITGLSTKTISRMIKTGGLSLNKAGLIPIAQIDKVLGL